MSRSRRYRINFDLYLYIFSVGVFVILGTLWWLDFHYFFHSEKMHAYDIRRELTIVALGDSLTTGYGIGRQASYIGVLERTIGRPIITSAKSGRTTADALATLDEDVISRDPDIVIIMLGGNDFLEGVPEPAMFANLREIILRIRDKTKAQTILVGVPAGYSDEYDDEFLKLAEETSSYYVPNILKGIVGNQQLLWDQIHPNDEGHKIMAERIYKALSPLLKKYED